MAKKITETEKEVLKVIKSRWALGRKRYKEGISFKQSEDPFIWLINAIEECADQLQYLVALKLAMKCAKRKSRKTHTSSRRP